MLAHTLGNLVTTVLAGSLCAVVALLIASSAGIVPPIGMWNISAALAQDPLACILLIVCIPILGELVKSAVAYLAYS